MQIGVLGAGSWGSALAIAFSQIATVKLWSHNLEQVKSINQCKINIKYLPCGILFNDNVVASNDLAEVLNFCDLIVIATPMKAFRDICVQIKRVNVIPDILWACKGFELDSGLLPHQIIAEISGNIENCGAFLGPSFAQEVANGLPTAITISSANMDFSLKWAGKLSEINNLRVYAHNDVIGAEVGGAVKNVMAIAVGISDGLGLGLNARAALITRSLNELSILVLALGGKMQTIYGLTGIGDLILTCTGDLSRNRTVGLKLAKGESLANIIVNLGHVAEGIYAAKEVYKLGDQLSLDMPIANAVYRILYTNSNINEEVSGLISRTYKAEF